MVFSFVVTFYAIWEQKTGFFKEVPGWGSLIIFIVALFLLGIVEGLQLALVELKRQDPETYKDSHPTAYRLGKITSKGDNIEKFLVGRQVIVVFLVFFSAKMTAITVPGQDFFFPIPSWFSSIFLETGLLASLIVVVVAQLTPQIVASVFPVQFLQLPFMKPVYYMCLLLEFTGLTHVCWLLVHMLSLLFGMSSGKEVGMLDNESVQSEDFGCIDNKALDCEGFTIAVTQEKAKVQPGPIKDAVCNCTCILHK